jgi:hypothetical protein
LQIQGNLEAKRIDMSDDTDARRVLAGFISREELMQTIRRSAPTIARLEAEGMPVCNLHGARYYPVEAVNRWLMARALSHPDPRVRNSQHVLTEAAPESAERVAA